MPKLNPGNRWLARYAILVAAATLGLIGLGGLVTSHGAGMAVPDWPTTYGYNMFLFPISQWVGGIFYEHTHRLYASVVGLLTVILAVWLQFRAADRRLARWGWVAVGLVIIQGVLGGLRVSLMKDQIGILHASLAQAFLVLLSLLALGVAPAWRSWTSHTAGFRSPSLAVTHRLWLLTTVLVFAQLLLGAAMRHQHAGLAVPDFPLAYGRVWPPTDPEFLQQVNAARIDTRDFHAITANQIYLHMGHRALAFVVASLMVISGLRLRRDFGKRSGPGRWGTAWIVLVTVQMLLGASTVWSNKAADIATLHVLVGACCLTMGAIGTAVCRAALRFPSERRETSPQSDATSERLHVPATLGVQA
ncbi:MAG: COX15/CtaA family protein [Verrucomicrobiales bacterium]|nr:COX15/CtaA family protein [Verrucomicrobiales bacterium]